MLILIKCQNVSFFDLKNFFSFGRGEFSLFTHFWHVVSFKLSWLLGIFDLLTLLTEFKGFLKNVNEESNWSFCWILYYFYSYFLTYYDSHNTLFINYKNIWGITLNMLKIYLICSAIKMSQVQICKI